MFNLCVITASDQLADHVQTAQAALAGGADMIQLRDKQLDCNDELLAIARQIMELKRQYSFHFVVNDCIEVALKCDADGVHLGQDDDGIDLARQILGNDKLIGISTHSLVEAVKAAEAGADYIGFGPMYATVSKDSPYSPRSADELRRIAETVQIPVCAIGGIEPEVLDELCVSPQVFCAVISGIRQGTGISEQVKAYIEALRSARKRRGF
ncbi:thiamine phosphate synthase [Desulfurispira natronophila]|uniref:Thiamine-phosphate synthase n=1 Tax=Desulfurispira natronophila TaxID=682562 RepID=A0A7W7Y2V1_9BACT|nr:thiamine phosphate synthase [Desulfurispira natronophila]MBB5021071.1 thiamine-phosphate pyrophosphorylase [Desulfurispira natronophila]